MKPVKEAQSAILKSTIFYPREYRHFSKMKRSTWFYLLLCVLPVTSIFFVLYSPISKMLCTWAGNMIALVGGQTLMRSTYEFLPWFGNLYYLVLEGPMPTYTHALISTIVCVVALVVLSQVEGSARALMIYLCMGLFVHLISSVFFLFFSAYFPYTHTDYSELYMKQQVAIWIMISFVSGVATALINSSGIAKWITFLSTVAYIFIFGCIRYVVYLLIVLYCSLMYMATLFFTFGVLFDFLQLVAIYSIFVKYMSTKMNTGRRRSEWLWS